MSQAITPRISVIVPNLHSPVVGQVLDSLCNQDYPESYEILVVGQDRYGQIQESERVKFIQTPHPVSSAKARNLGISSARGEVLAFTDSDCIAFPDWLSTLARRLQDDDVSVVGGGVNFPKENFWTRCDNLATFHEYLAVSEPGNRLQLPSLNLALRRSVLDEVGVFDERYPIPAGEDADLTTRIWMTGYRLYFEPRATVIHLPQRRSPIAVFRHAYNFGRFSVKIDPRYRSALKSPLILRHWLSVLVLSPILAAGVIWSMLRRKIISGRDIFLLPAIYVTKIAWCLGAAHTLYHGSPFEERS